MHSKHLLQKTKVSEKVQKKVQKIGATNVACAREWGNILEGNKCFLNNVYSFVGAFLHGRGFGRGNTGILHFSLYFVIDIDKVQCPSRLGLQNVSLLLVCFCASKNRQLKLI